MSQTLKVGTHRGNKRVWIEGKNLMAAGFLPGQLYTTEYSDNTITLNCSTGESGVSTRKVSNKKGTHPIIDMNSKAVSKFFEGSDSCDVDFIIGTIIIYRS